jgi:hypothetical protein
MGGIRLVVATLAAALTTGPLVALASQRPATQPDAPLALFFEAASTDAAAADRALAALATRWRDGYAALLVDLARFFNAPRGPQTAGAPRQDRDYTGGPPAADPIMLPIEIGAAGQTNVHPVRARLVRFLERQTGQRFGADLRKWREWIWKRPYEPHPDYLAFKAALYRGAVDPAMGEFFTNRSVVRLDEIDWGGVKVNGIPPLRSPRTVAVAEAGWLKDDHIVFGLVVNGEARAYPKRILAWHEMALDDIGGVKLAIVYCTLCGTVIPYRSTVGGVPRTFGTSGLLYRSNKLMFDEESRSLWSTLEGKPVVGPLAGSSLTLEFEPVVTTTWGEWRRTHPQTRVVSLDTGFDRDYDEGEAYRDYFASDDLMFPVSRMDRRLKNKDEILGVLLPAAGGGRTAVAFSVDYLARRRIHQGRWEGVNLVVVTTSEGASRVYDAGPNQFVRWDGASHVVDGSGQRWQVTEEALVGRGGRQRLARRPAFRAFWFGWFAQFPETVLVR